MSKYTTGEIAKLCGVSVRTVQYYDSREILVPSELSDGGRRLYSDDDLKKLKLICFLRDIGFSIDNIYKLLKEENSDKVVAYLLKEQESVLKKEISERKAKLEILEEINNYVEFNNVSLKKISGIADVMGSKKKLRKIHLTMLLSGIVVELAEIASIVLWIVMGLWIPFAVVMPLAVIWAVYISAYYFNNVRYICPECSHKFKPKFKNAFFANHTPRTRKLVCPNCGKKSFCIETAKEDNE